MSKFWPSPIDYFEAVQTPAQSFADDGLRTARVTEDELGMPRPWSGNFASVYQFHAADGQRTWAIKCFKNPVPHLSLRYQEISRCLRGANLPLTVAFEYLPQGIRIRGEWFPILKMEWVEGQTLRQFVAEHLSEPYILQRLFGLWLKVEQWLASAGVAHGDLQHGNLLLVSGARPNYAELKLIDYDGMWIPGLAAYPAGECGHPAYQHPGRERDQVYGPQIDRFPNLVIACALSCLSRPQGPLWWQRYDNGDNLLFQKADFEQPEHSELLRELWESRDEELQSWVAWLICAARSPLDATPALEELVIEGQLRPAEQRWRDEAARYFEQTAASRPSNAAPLVEFSSIGPEDGWPLEPVQVAGQEPAQEVAANRESASASSVWPWGAVTVMLLAGLAAVGSTFQTRQTSRRIPAAPPAPVHHAAHQRPVRHDRHKTRNRPAPAAPDADTAASVPVDPFSGFRAGQERDDNSLKMKFVWCPAGDFVMGTAPAARADASRGGGLIRVTLTQGYWLGKYEVTQHQWMRLMNTQPWQQSDDVRKGDNFPAVDVRWDHATAFCRTLTAAERDAGRIHEDCEYVLPTEAQWEYACRAGTTTQFGFGDAADLLGDFGWYVNNTLQVNEPFAHETGTKRPNAWGLHDMHGNVAEMCRDGFLISLPGGPDPLVAIATSPPVVRGGSWDDSADNCRSTSRGPLARPAPLVGFRVALVRTTSAANL